jgi:hypothetical protein
VSVVAEACSSANEATPIPEPPSLDPERVGLPPGPSLFGALITIQGQPGATNPRATIRVTNLDSALEPVEVRADRSGGFEVQVEILEGNEVRLQALADDRRGDPVDFIYATEALEAPSRHACFQITSGLDLVFGEEPIAEILLENACAADATVDAAGTRLALSDFALETALPIVVPAGESAVVRIEHASASREEREDVLFLNVGVDGELRRYPVTLFAPAP